MGKLTTGIVVAVVTAFLAVGVAVAGGSATKTTLKATLTTGQEVPKPKGVTPGTTGLFTATLTRAADGSGTLTWKLTYRRLTGAATGAHLHLGRPGKTGAVAVALCGPCTSGATGTSPVTAAQANALLRNGMYANVHTEKNPAGEIRGQVTKGAAR